MICIIFYRRHIDRCNIYIKTTNQYNFFFLFLWWIQKRKKKSCDQLESTRNNLDSVTNTIKIRKESVFFFFLRRKESAFASNMPWFFLLVPLKMPWFKLESNEIARIVFLLFFCIFLMIDWTKQLSWSLCSHHWIMTNNFLGTLDY